MTVFHVLLVLVRPVLRSRAALAAESRAICHDILQFCARVLAT